MAKAVRGRPGHEPGRREGIRGGGETAGRARRSSSPAAARDVLERLLAEVLPAEEELRVDPLRLEPPLHVLDDVRRLERPAGVDVDADEAVVRRGVDLDAALDDRDPAAVAGLAGERRLAGLEDVGLGLLGHVEPERDLVEELVAPVQIAADRLVAAETVDDQLEAPRRLVLGALAATVLLFHGRAPMGEVPPVLAPCRHGRGRGRSRVRLLLSYRPKVRHGAETVSRFLHFSSSLSTA